MSETPEVSRFQRVRIELGDTIEVGGYSFVLSELISAKDKPPRVVFISPSENLERLAKIRINAFEVMKTWSVRGELSDGIRSETSE